MYISLHIPDTCPCVHHLSDIYITSHHLSDTYITSQMHIPYSKYIYIYIYKIYIYIYIYIYNTYLCIWYVIRYMYTCIFCVNTCVWYVYLLSDYTHQMHVSHIKDTCVHISDHVSDTHTRTYTQTHECTCKYTYIACESTGACVWLGVCVRIRARVCTHMFKVESVGV